MEQEFKDNLSKDTELQAKVLDILKGTELGQNYAKTIAQNYFDENISSEHKKIYDFVDNALLESGLEKPAGVKTSEWAKIIAEQNKELREKLDTFKSNSKPDETLKKLEELKARYKKEKAQLTQTAQEQINEKESLIEQLQNREKNLFRKGEIQNVISKLEFNKGLDDSIINDIIKMKTQNLISNSKEEDGKIIWCKSDGTPYKDGILNASLDSILHQELKGILQQTSSGGAAGNTPTTGDFTGSQVLLTESSFKTQEQFLLEFDKVAQRKGIPKGEDYDKLYWEAFNRYNVKNLKEF